MSSPLLSRSVLGIVYVRQKEIASKIIKDSPWKKHKKRQPTDPLLMSEYEMVSSLETSCNKLKGYNYKDNDWVRVSEEGKMPVSFSFGGENPDLGSLNFEKEIGEQRSVREYDDKQINSYCLKIVEDRDEQLTDLIQSKSLTTENVRQNVINKLCGWEQKKKSPCKTQDELNGIFAGMAADQGAAKAAEIDGDVEEKKETEGKGEKKEKAKKAKKAPSSKKTKKSASSDEL